MVISFISIIVKYKTKVRSEIYPLDKYAKMKLTNSSDNLIGSFVTHRVIQSSSNSSSGRSFGGSGGGSRGSGHRGGR